MKLKVYVCSLEFPTDGFIDKEGARHACADAQGTAFQGLQRVAGILGKRYLSDEERKVLMQVEGFCKNNGLEYEIIDLGTMSFLARLRLRMKGVRAPAVCCGEKMVLGVPCEEDFEMLLGDSRTENKVA